MFQTPLPSIFNYIIQNFKKNWHISLNPVVRDNITTMLSLTYQIFPVVNGQTNTATLLLLSTAAYRDHPVVTLLWESWVVSTLIFVRNPLLWCLLLWTSTKQVFFNSSSGFNFFWLLILETAKLCRLFYQGKMYFVII